MSGTGRRRQNLFTRRAKRKLVRRCAVIVWSCAGCPSSVGANGFRSGSIPGGARKARSASRKGVVMFKVQANVLRDMLAGALTCVSDDQTSPTITCVHMVVVGRTFTVESTDRYRAIFGTYELAAESVVCSAFINRKDVKLLLSVMPKGKAAQNLEVSVGVGADSVVVDWGTGSLTMGMADGLWPALSKLYPGVELASLPGGVFSVSAQLLEAICKVPNPRNHPWVMRFFGPDRPMTGMLAAEGEPSWLFLLMPKK